MLASLLSPYTSTVLCRWPFPRDFSVSHALQGGCRSDNPAGTIPWRRRFRRQGGHSMTRGTVAGLVAVVFALGMTTAGNAQAPASKAEDKKPAETVEKKTEKPAEKKPAVKKEAKAQAKPAEKAPAKVEKKDEKPGEKAVEKTVEPKK
jgi:outer membrane biosynthesis protein TonB